MFESAEKIKNPVERKDAIDQILEEGYHLTDVMLAEPAIRVEALELIQGITRDVSTNNRPVEHSELARPEEFLLQTVDGRALGKIKVGQKPQSIDTKRLARMNQRGKSADIVRDFPSDFTVGGKLALNLLSHYGYGFVDMRWRRRHVRSRGEVNSHNKPMTPIDQWRLVEHNSRFAYQAADQLVKRARNEHSEFEPVEPAEAIRLLERAQQLVDEHPGAREALRELKKKR